MLQRAHRTVEDRIPELSQQVTLRSLGDERLRAIVDRYVRAWEQNDVGAIAAMLTDSATIAMPPTATWYRGRDAVVTSLEELPLSGRMTWRMTPTRANGQLAVMGCTRDTNGTFVPNHLAVLTLRDSLIDEINAFLIATSH
jgi:RNA polymerase sigma-70 factor (ECF subfamily)